MKSLKLHAVAMFGAASLVGAGVANALPPGDYDGTVLNVYYSGATATDNILENLFLTKTGGACADGTIDVYRVTASNRGNRVIFCRVTAAEVAGFPASDTTTVPGVETGGRKVAFHKESIGGSSNGVVPLIGQTTLEFYNMALAGTGCTFSNVAATTSLNGYGQYTACTDNTITTVPTAGISDVEPRLSFPVPAASGLATLNSVVGLDVVFGVPVSENLYRALQVAQGYITDDVSKTPTAKCVGGIDTPTCMPSLSRSQIRGLFTQATSNWDQLFVGNGTATAEDGISLTAFTGVTPPTNTNQGGGADNKVFICRRVASSGTQAAAETYFLKQRCQNGVRTFAGGNSLTGAPTDFIARVTFSESSGDVRTCLSAHNTNKTWAVGVLSTEQTSNSGWRMVAIDGAAPNLANVMNGRYDYFTTNTFNRRATGQTGAPTGEALLLVQKLESDVNNIPLVAAANSGFQNRAFGDGGLLVRYSSANARKPDAVNGNTTTRSNPVNSQSKLVGSVLNNCIDPVSSGNAANPGTGLILKGTLIGD